MPSYEKSRACKTCELEFVELSRINNEAHSDDCKLHAVRVSVLSNSMLIGSAKLENYLSDVIGDWASQVNASQLRTDELPLTIRARFFNQSDVLGTYSSYFQTHDEIALARKTITLMSRDRTDSAGTEPRPRIYANWILEGCKYPSPDNLRHLFRRLGVNDLFKELNVLARRDVELTIRSFNDLRSELAHQGNVSGVTYQDVSDKLEEALEVVHLIDQVLFKEIGEIGGNLLWTT